MGIELSQSGIDRRIWGNDNGYYGKTIAFVFDNYSAQVMLYETPELNTSTYHFKSMEYSASCSLFDVNITVLEDSIKFPYYFEKTYTPISFKINVEMTYLGESFSYTSGVGYLEGANIKFINKTNKIIHEPILAPDVVTEFYIYTGMKITDVYEFTDGNPKNEVGIYDMIISYKDEEIVVKDFLNLAR